MIRVKSMRRPDLLRVSEPYKDGKPGINRAGIFAFYGANKYSMALDLRHPQAIRVLTRLISWADIVTENFAQARLRKWALDTTN